MYRAVISAAIAVAILLGLSGEAAKHGDLEGAIAAAQASSTPDGLCESGTPAAWELADVRPTKQYDAAVFPPTSPATPGVDGDIEATPDGTPTSTTANHLLYLVVITLPPGHCMPYSTPGNDKDGQIVLLVQQGVVEFKWTPLGTGIVGSKPPVIRGDSMGHAHAAAADLEPGEVRQDRTQTLYPGDWITLNQNVNFSYSNVGGESAIIVKAVWATDHIGGCGGGCK